MQSPIPAGPGRSRDIPSQPTIPGPVKIYIGNSDAIVAILYIYISPTHQSWRARDIPSRPAISRSRPEYGKRKPGPVPYAEIATRAHPIPRRFDPGPSHYTLFQTRPGPDPVPCPGRDSPGWDFPDPVVSLVYYNHHITASGRYWEFLNKIYRDLAPFAFRDG